MTDETYSRPEVLKYITGEISFDTWLQNQQGGNTYESKQQTARTGAVVSPEAGSASIFSSWGSAFTGDSQGSSSQHTMESREADEEESDYDEDDDSDEEVSIMKSKS